MNVDTLDPRPAEPRRDRLGRYLVDGRSYRRVTTLIKPLDDPTNLTAWLQRMVAIGLAHRHDLVATVAATDPDDKKTINQICDQAVDIAGGATGRNMGTALHELARRALVAGHLDQVPPGYRERIQALIDTLADHQFNVVATEQVVIVDDLDTAGTFDIAAERDGKTYVLDIKTGSVADYKWLGFAAQLACYANNTATVDLAADKAGPRLELDRTVGYVIHLPPEAGQPCTVLEVDLVFGWKAARAARAILDFRTQGRKRAHVATPPGHYAKNLSAVRNLCKSRISALPDDARVLIAQRWPDGVPTLKTPHEHTSDQLDQIAVLLDSVEAQTRAPFPIEPDIRPVDPTPGVVVVPNLDQFEGYNITQAEYDELVDRLDILTDQHRALIDEWALEAHQAGHSISLRQRQSIRRAEIVRAAIHLLLVHNPDGILDAVGAPRHHTIGGRLGQLTTAVARAIPRAIPQTNSQEHTP